MSYDIPTSTKEKSNFEVVLIRPSDQYYILEFVEVKDAKKEGTFGAKSVFLFNVVEHNKKLAVTAYKRPATKTNMMGNIFTALGIPINDSTIDVTKFYGTKCKGLIEDFKKKTKDAEGKETEVLTSVIAKIKPLVEKPEVITPKV
jgi:hypothetical protein